MAAWIGPTIAISLLIIALCVLGAMLALVVAGREMAARTTSLSKELGELRAELTPALHALNRMGEGGAEVAELVKEEVREVIYTTRRLRKDVERASVRARNRLGDFDALLEVVQEEVEESALDLATALRTARMGRGMIGQLRRLIVPRRRPRE